MTYNLTVMILLIMYFIFVYETYKNVQVYCLSDNSADSNAAFDSAIGSSILAVLFAIWAWYEYNSTRKSILNIKATMKREKELQDEEDYKNAPDPNILSAMLKNAELEASANPAPLTTPSSIPSSIPSIPVSIPANPNKSEFNKYEAVNADSSIGEITRGYNL